MPAKYAWAIIKAEHGLKKNKNQCNTLKLLSDPELSINLYLFWQGNFYTNKSYNM